MSENRNWENWWQTSYREKGTTISNKPKPPFNAHPVRQLSHKLISEIGGSILDAGCASGADYLEFIGDGLKYEGFDITPKRIKKFKQYHPEAKVQVASALKIPFPDESFTSVYSGGVIQHMHPEEYTNAINEMWRVTKRLLVITVNKLSDGDHRIRLKNRNNFTVYNNIYGKHKLHRFLQSLPKVKNIIIHDNLKIPKEYTNGVVIAVYKS